MNKVILLGRLTKTPEIKYSQTNNIKIARFTLAVNRRFTKEGEERQTDFINIVAYAKSAEFVEKYLSQGIQICISGRLQINSWEDEQGQRHYFSEVIAEEIDFADKPKKTDESVLISNTTVNFQSQENIDNNDVISNDDDLPF